MHVSMYRTWIKNLHALQNPNVLSANSLTLLCRRQEYT